MLCMEKDSGGMEYSVGCKDTTNWLMYTSLELSCSCCVQSCVTCLSKPVAIIFIIILIVVLLLINVPPASASFSCCSSVSNLPFHILVQKFEESGATGIFKILQFAGKDL